MFVPPAYNNPSNDRERPLQWCRCAEVGDGGIYYGALDLKIFASPDPDNRTGRYNVRACVRATDELDLVLLLVACMRDLEVSFAIT
jgi:hypothetical protein